MTEEKISFISPEVVTIKPILSGDIGKGYNILTGLPTEFLFQNLKVQCLSGRGESERSFWFKDTNEFLRETVTRVGLPSLEKGMFSLCEKNSILPFLCDVENLEKTQHLFTEAERHVYDLKMDSLGALSKSLKEEERRLKEIPFSKQSKSIYYNFIQKYGTHFVKNASFGNKAELRWTIKLKHLESDTLTKVTKNQQYKQRFDDCYKLWKIGSFDTKGENSKKIKKSAPKNCEVEMKVTSGFVNPSAATGSVQIGFTLFPINVLFEDSVSKDIDLAVRCYLEEMRPKSTSEDATDTEIVGLYCLDNSCWLRTDDHGHIYADGTEISAENKFEIRKKGTKLGFKSLRFQNKYLSKALMRSIFHFHKLQFMGPHESFEIAGDYLFVGATLVENVGFLYVGEDKQIHISETKRSRIVVLNAEVRNSNILTPDEIKEPQYVEDETMSMLDFPDELPPPSLKETPKANSTSSLFIKDTIILPNVDELTRCMALHLSSLIKEGHSVSKLNIPEIFNEDIYPLTKSVPKLQNMRVPSVETVFHFLNTIFKVEKLSPEPGIMALVYIDRVMEKTRMHLHAASWRRAVLASLIIASKVWEDQSVWTVDFLELFPSANIKDLNRLEQNILAILDFNVSIKASDYVRHYFELRTFMKSDFSDRGGKPLDHEALQKLEIRSASSEEEWKAPFRLLKAATATALTDSSKKKIGLGVLS